MVFSKRIQLNSSPHSLFTESGFIINHKHDYSHHTFNFTLIDGTVVYVIVMNCHRETAYCLKETHFLTQRRAWSFLTIDSKN